MRKAVAVIRTRNTRLGLVLFQETKSRGTKITYDLSGLRPNETYASHIHEFGDLSGGCDTLGGHWDGRRGRTHGSRRLDGTDRHIGDLVNNVTSDAVGHVRVTFYDDLVTLHGRHSVVGRSVVVHRGVDDLGRGGTAESLESGSAGSRLACGVIGWRG